MTKINIRNSLINFAQENERKSEQADTFPMLSDYLKVQHKMNGSQGMY